MHKSNQLIELTRHKKFEDKPKYLIAIFIQHDNIFLDNI